MEACHIYDIKLIKKDLENYINKEIKIVDENTQYDQKILDLLNAADDHQNGLMLTRNMHKLFDERRFWFNNEGYISYRKEYETMIKNQLQSEIDKVFIKKNVLSNRMKNYITLKNQLLKF